MKSRFLKIFLLLIFSLTSINAYGVNEFNFDVSEIEITDDGNIFKGLKKGQVQSNDGLILNANSFKYNKKLNILEASGNVEIKDTTKNYNINSNKIIYFKNEEKIITEGNSKGFNLENGIEINAEVFEYTDQSIKL